MKKILIILFCSVLFFQLFACETTGDENEIENNENEIENSENESIVSVWPDELPARPYNLAGEENEALSVELNLNEMWLYDMPKFSDFENVNTIGNYYRDKGMLYILIYDYNSDTNDVPKEMYDEYIELLKKAGYTENAIENENMYECEKYGVKIKIAYSNSYPWEESRPVRPPNFGYNCLIVRTEIIDIDYVIDLDEVKRTEKDNMKIAE